MSDIIYKISKIITEVPEIELANSSIAWHYHETQEMKKRCGDVYEPHFGELVEESVGLNFFHPWDYISFLSESRDTKEFEQQFKENWKKSTETKMIASSLSWITNAYRMSKHQVYIVERKDNSITFCMFIQFADSDKIIFPANDEFIEKFKKIFEPYGILCKNIENIYIHNKRFYALEFSFEHKEESTN